ncbi:MAG TPA: fibronectin type III domain-containing protein, partial [Rugosimonospora sp.]|nr:fibronectin type III domain-containing protein [Rugosimonospora sp.]
CGAAVPRSVCPPAAGITAGGRHSCAFRAGSLFCWGYDGSGAVGGGLTGLDMPPVPVDTSGVLSGVVLRQVAAGANHTCALSTSGGAYCWGDNSHGQLGDGTTSERDTPVAVDTSGVLEGVRLADISAGGDHTCAVSTAGAAFCWGDNGHGQLGDGTTDERDSPVAVDTGVQLGALAAGGSHTCAVSAAGLVFCWGDNGHGQLGDGSTTDRDRPVAADTSAVFAAVAAGGRHTCAVSTGGAAFCWGDNGHGQLGDGTTSERDSPVAVTTGATLSALAAGGSHTCAVSTGGAAYCWGGNGHGQLGDGTTTDRHTPVAVDASGALSGVDLAGVGAGPEHACVLSTVDQAYCWGDGDDGRLGDGTGVDQPAPVPVRPGPPIGVAASGEDSALDVSWLPPLGLYGGTLSGYTATTDPGNFTCTATAPDTGCWIRGLANGTAYSVSVVAHTDAGDSVPAISAEAATPVALPDPPTGVRASAGDGEVYVTWSPPVVLGTGAFTGYTAIAYPGGDTCVSTTDTQCTITGLDNGVVYVVTAVTSTTLGDSMESDPSNAVTPDLPAVVLPPAVPPANGSLGSSAGTVFSDTRRTTTLSGDGFLAGSPVLVGLYSVPRELAEITADGSGRIRVRVTVPDGYTGGHTFVAAGLAPDHRQRALTLAVTVTGDGLAQTGSALLATLVVMGVGLLAAGGVAVASFRRRTPAQA